MKKGDRFHCPFCKEDSFLAEEAVMDNWTKKGTILKCAFCGKKIGDVSPEEQQKTEEDTSALRLQALLGEKPEKKISLSFSDADRRFCKDCAYLVKHPFHLTCSLHEKEVEPMQDCPDYKVRKDPSGDGL